MAALLIEALKEAEDLEQLDSNWAVKQNVEETIKFLHQVITLFSLLTLLNVLIGVRFGNDFLCTNIGPF